MWRRGPDASLALWLREPAARAAQGLDAYRGNAAAIAERALAAAFPTVQQLMGESPSRSWHACSGTASRRAAATSRATAMRCPTGSPTTRSSRRSRTCADVARVDWAVHAIEHAADVPCAAGGPGTARRARSVAADAAPAAGTGAGGVALAGGDHLAGPPQRRRRSLCAGAAGLRGACGRDRTGGAAAVARLRCAAVDDASATLHGRAAKRRHAGPLRSTRPARRFSSNPGCTTPCASNGCRRWSQRSTHLPEGPDDFAGSATCSVRPNARCAHWRRCSRWRNWRRACTWPRCSCCRD